MKRTFRNRRFVITGAAGGLGRALCLELGQRGAFLIGFDSNADALKEASEDLRAQSIAHHFQLLNITDAVAVSRALAPLRSDGVDGLILNAGITRIAPFEELPFDQFQKVFEVNVFGAVLFAKELLPLIRTAKGIIAGISSVSGFAPLINRTAYAASKHALAGFLETLRTEEPSVDVLVVFPSFLQTAIREGQTQDERQKREHPELSAELAARRIVRAIEKRQKRLYLPFQARLARWIWNLFPDLYIRLMKRRV